MQNDKFQDGPKQNAKFKMQNSGWTKQQCKFQNAKFKVQNNRFKDGPNHNAKFKMENNKIAME